MVYWVIRFSKRGSFIVASKLLEVQIVSHTVTWSYVWLFGYFDGTAIQAPLSPPSTNLDPPLKSFSMFQMICGPKSKSKIFVCTKHFFFAPNHLKHRKNRFQGGVPKLRTPVWRRGQNSLFFQYTSRISLLTLEIISILNNTLCITTNSSTLYT